jgi:hypothetical protein
MAAPKKAQSQVGSISKLLKGANEAPKKRESSAVEINEFGKLADEVAATKVAYEDAEAAFRLKESEILEVANHIYSERAKSEFSKSYNFVGQADPGVQVVYTDRFSDLPAESEPGLREALGDRYENFFEESRKLELSKTDDATIQLLIKKLGEETFLDIFKIKVAIKAKSDMDRKQFDLPETVRQQLKQAKPGVKLIKE